MSLGDPGILAAICDGLATPPLSPHPGAHVHLHSRTATPTASTGRMTGLHLASTKSINVGSAMFTPLPSVPVTPINSSPDYSHVDTLGIALPVGSLLPNKLPLEPPTQPPNAPRNGYLPVLHVDTTESLTREKKGKMPSLSHLLSVGKGRVLALAADDKYVYAGCQSADNEIVVSLNVWKTEILGVGLYRAHNLGLLENILAAHV